MSADLAAAPIDDLREFVHTERERLSIPGVSIALIDEGAVEYLTAGVRRADQARDVTSTDAFDTGSISKTVTAWAVMNLVELNLVALDAPIDQYIDPRWRLPESKFDHSGVTLRRILSHTAGLSAPSYQGLPFGSTAISLEDSLNGHPVRSSSVRVIVEPGTEVRYSGGGFALAQLVVESVTAQSFEDFVTLEVFGPLGMHDAGYLDLDEQPLAVSPHDYSGRPIPDYRLVEQGAGGLMASARDMANFALANMSPNAVLAASTISEMHEPIALDSGRMQQSLGFARLGGVLSHGGHGRGWVAHIDVHPSSRSGLVILTNSANGLHFVQPVRCRWAELYEIDDLVAFCAQEGRMARISSWALRAVAAGALLLAGYILWRAWVRVGLRAAQVTFDARSLVRSLPYALAIVAMWSLLGTGWGVYLVTGVQWGLPTLGYFSVATQHAVMAVTLLLGALAFTAFVAPRRSSGKGSASHGKQIDNHEPG